MDNKQNTILEILWQEDWKLRVRKFTNIANWQTFQFSDKGEQPGFYINDANGRNSAILRQDGELNIKRKGMLKFEATGRKFNTKNANEIKQAVRLAYLLTQQPIRQQPQVKS